MQTTDALTFGNVISYDSKTGYGTVEYVEKEDNQTKRATFGFNQQAALVVRDRSVYWTDSSMDDDQTEPDPIIAIEDVDSHDRVSRWVNESYAVASFIWAHSTYYTINDGAGVPLWSGYLTSQGEIHNTQGVLPRILDEDMYMQTILSDVYSHGALQEVSDSLTFDVWKRVISATRVAVPA